jgi:putative ABC transport system permease protein
MDNFKPMTIVGVVGDIRQSGPAAVAFAEIFMPYQQHPLPSTAMRILVRTSLPAEKITPALRRIANQLAPMMPVKFTTMEERAAKNVSAPRFRTLLLVIFAGIAAVLSMAGIYGVTAFLVSQRTQEIGLRMALGAGAERVAKMILSRGVGMALIGLVVGVAASAGLARFLQSMLFEVQPFDPATYATVGIAVVGITLGACLLPAWRAARIDPMRALRQE